MPEYNPPVQNDGGIKRFFTATGYLSTGHWLLQTISVPLGGVLSGWGVQYLVPYSPDHPAQYWLATAAAVLTGSLAVQFVWAGGHVAIPKIRHRINPPILVLGAQAGRIASLELKHSGYPVTWRARARIRSTGGVAPSNPRWSEAPIQWGSRHDASRPMREDDIGYIWLAEIITPDNPFSGGQRLGVLGNMLMHVDKAEVQIDIKETNGKQRYVRSYELLWDRNHDTITVNEVKRHDSL